MRPLRARSAPITVVVLAASLLVTPTAHAGKGAPPQRANKTAPPNKAAPVNKDTADKAASLKAEGDNDMIDKRYEDALAAYEASYKLSPNPVLHYNRGRALQFLARYPEALAALRSFVEEAPPDVRARVAALQDIIAEVKAKVAVVRLRCDVKGARVLIGKREIGITPLSGAIPVNAGGATLEVVADGYLPFVRDVELRGDEAENDLEATLQSKSEVGILVVRSSLSGTRVAVDGRALGVAPAETALLAGKHTVAVSSEDHDPAQTQVIIAAGERKLLELNPIARAPVYKTWWFWSTLGVVATGAVLITVAVTKERSPAVGTFSPGLVRF